MRRHRRTKILATLGPSSSERDMIARLFEAGVDLFRINMSHTSHEMLRDLVARIRDVERSYMRPIGILADLQGPKLRLGRFENGAAMLERTRRFVLDSDPTPGGVDRVHLPHPEILHALEVGHALLLDDGKVRLVAREITADCAITEVVVGGRVSDRKGVNLPDTTLGFSSLTPKDREDLVAALEQEVDWIGVSFIQRPEDVTEVRDIVKGRAGIMSKIEKPQAVARLAEILELSDSVMVARGDLGVEMPMERLPGVQKQMTRAARRAGKPVIVATQMLESMISSPVPTRAEVSDVAAAVFEGSDAIMLSAESAAGQYPVEAVTMMSKIAEQVELDPTYRQVIDAQRQPPQPTGADAIAAAARTIADTLDMKAIVAWTGSGATGLRAARERPRAPIIALTPNLQTSRRLCCVYGIHSVWTEDAVDMADVVQRACAFAENQEFAARGDRVIILAGVPLKTPGATNMLRIAFVGGEPVPAAAAE